MFIDKIYVIALDHSEENLGAIKERLDSLNVPETPYEIIKAHDGRVDPLPNGFKLYDWAMPESDNGWWKYPLRPGEIGCTVSHIKVWRKMLDEDHTRVLVLEEDFLPLKGLMQLPEEEVGPIDWDLCYLGRNRIDKSLAERQISDNLCFPAPSYNAHAYLLRSTGAFNLLHGGIIDNIIPVDEYLIAKYSDHPRTDIRQLFGSSRINVIATRDEWIKQTSTPQNSTIGHPTSEQNEEYFEILDTSDWNAWCDRYINQTIRNQEYSLIVDEIRDTNILEFPLFTEKFCREAVALAETKNKWTVDRHEFYPTNDVLLGEIGLNDAYQRVIDEIIQPLCKSWWQLEGKDWDRLIGENFMARYTTDRQSHLSLHHDYSHITMVVKLNDEFDGGGTWFPKYRVLSNPERVGTATLHPGLITHLHGARPITAGRRYITVSFMRKNQGNI